MFYLQEIHIKLILPYMLLGPESLILLQGFQPKFRTLLSPPCLHAVSSVYVILLDLITLIIFLGRWRCCKRRSVTETQTVH